MFQTPPLNQKSAKVVKTYTRQVPGLQTMARKSVFTHIIAIGRVTERHKGLNCRWILASTESAVLEMVSRLTAG